MYKWLLQKSAGSSIFEDEKLTGWNLQHVRWKRKSLSHPCKEARKLSYYWSYLQQDWRAELAARAALPLRRRPELRRRPRGEGPRRSAFPARLRRLPLFCFSPAVFPLWTQRLRSFRCPAAITATTSADLYPFALPFAKFWIHGDDASVHGSQNPSQEHRI